MKLDLTNRVVLITGASRGIGEAIALRMGQAGARVALHYNHNHEKAEALASQIGPGTGVFQAELTRPEVCDTFFQQVVEQMGQVDVLVNNAGLAVHTAMDADLTEWVADWDQTHHVNLRATAVLCRAAILHFLERGGGRIINISSRAAFRGDTAEYLAYAASKGGMVALTRTIARAYGKQGVVAFDVAPGFTRTDMAQDFIDTYGEAYAVQNLALDRMTEPDDIAPLVVLLASGLADHATGTSIDVNAGSYVH